MERRSGLTWIKPRSLSSRSQCNSGPSSPRMDCKTEPPTFIARRHNVNRKTILSALLLATAASMSAGVFATDNDMPMASEASGAHKMKPHSHVAEKAGASAASAPAAAPRRGHQGQGQVQAFPSRYQVSLRAGSEKSPRFNSPDLRQRSSARCG